MPKITERTFFNGTDKKLDRLGLRAIWKQLETLLTRFDLRVAESKDANGGAAVRELLDGRFQAVAQGKGVKSALGSLRLIRKKIGSEKGQSLFWSAASNPE